MLILRVILLLLCGGATGLGIAGIDRAAAQGRSLANRVAKPQLHIVLLGVSEYRETSSLPTVRKDLLLVTDAFRSLGERADVLSLTALHDGTRDDILKTVSEVAGKAKATDAPILIYWAGHSGYDEKQDRLQLMPSDARPSRGASSEGLGYENIIDFVADFLPLFAPNSKVLFLGDGCNIGESLVSHVASKYRNFVMLSASKVDEEVLDSVPHLNDHGAFAYFLDEALRRPIKDIDDDGFLSVDDLYIHMYPRVVEALRKSSLSNVQHPALFGRYSHRFQIAAAMAPIKEGDRVALSFPDGVPKELLDLSQLKLNGHDVSVVVDTAGKSIEIAAADSYSVPNGLNEIAWGDEKQRFRVWNERRTLKLFEHPYKNSRAILVAIDDYDRPGDKTLATRVGLVAQAKRLKTVLEQLGFSDFTELYNEDATRQRLDDELRAHWFGGKYEKVDRLFVFFGGHGYSAKDVAGRDQSLLVTYDYDLRRPLQTTFLSNDLRDRHSSNIAANHVMFALDVCLGGIVTMRQGDRVDPRMAETDSRLRLIKDEIEKRARNFLVAGTKDQDAIYLKDRGGLFTEKLIEALQGSADEDNDGLLTFTELSQYVKKGVIRAIQEDPTIKGHDQVPDRDWVGGIGKGDTLFFPAGNARIKVAVPIVPVLNSDRDSFMRDSFRR